MKNNYMVEIIRVTHHKRKRKLTPKIKMVCSCGNRFSVTTPVATAKLKRCVVCEFESEKYGRYTVADVAMCAGDILAHIIKHKGDILDG